MNHPTLLNSLMCNVSLRSGKNLPICKIGSATKNVPLKSLFETNNLYRHKPEKQRLPLFSWSPLIQGNTFKWLFLWVFSSYNTSSGCLKGDRTVTFWICRLQSKTLLMADIFIKHRFCITLGSVSCRAFCKDK